MTELRQRFTKWYYRKGYRMAYKICDYGDNIAELKFFCPWWVRPCVGWFFSPSVYYYEAGYDVTEAFLKSLPKFE